MQNKNWKKSFSNFFKGHKSLIFKLGLSTTALVGTFGLVYGLASAHSYSQFIDFDNATNHISYGGGITPLETKWNCSDQTGKVTVDFNGYDKFAEEVIDGSNHQVLDKSFNEGAYKGLYVWQQGQWKPGDEYPTVSDEQINEFYSKDNNNYSGKPANDQPAGFVSTYSAAVDAGKKVLVLPGYLHSTPLSQFKTSRQDTYNKAGYILIDSNMENDKRIASVMFRADQSAFLAGLSACTYLSLNQKNFEHYIKKGPLSVGTFGGTSIPTVTIFMGGFERGVQFFNNYVLPLMNYSDEDFEQHKVNVINLGKEDSYFSGTFTIGDGRSVVQNLLARGADAIMPVAGPQTIDTVQEIKNQKSDCIVVGVDTDQENSDMNETSVYDDGSDSKYHDKIIKFSAEKNIAYMTSAILKLAEKKEETYSTDGKVKIGSFGYLTVGDLNNNGCKVSSGGEQYIVDMVKTIFKISPSQQMTYAEALSKLLKEKPSTSWTDPLKYIDDNMEFTF